jgi:hypothetical protein
MGDEPIRMNNILCIHETGEQDGQPYFSLGGIGASHVHETSSPH